jgi:hypothetical protein
MKLMSVWPVVAIVTGAGPVISYEGRALNDPKTSTVLPSRAR